LLDLTILQKIVKIILSAFALPVDDAEYRWNVVADQEGRMHVYDDKPVELEQEIEPSFNAMTDVIFLLFTRRNPTVVKLKIFFFDFFL
jgi:hypothetical protein